MSPNRTWLSEGALLKFSGFSRNRTFSDSAPPSLSPRKSCSDHFLSLFFDYSLLVTDKSLLRFASSVIVNKNAVQAGDFVSL